jgi:hypothetical protein
MIESGTSASPADGWDSPRQAYTRNPERHRAALRVEQKRERLLGYAKAALLLAMVGLGIALMHSPSRLVWLGVPLAAFVVCAILHDRVLRSIGGHNRVIEYYERGLARLNDQWAGTGETGERFSEAEHPYARDLDIFGKGSLFELLCTARTRAGEETLARWLLHPAPVPEVHARQEAVRELTPLLEMRERLFTAGDSARLGVHPERLAQWAETEVNSGPAYLRILMVLLGAVWLGALAWWVTTLSWMPLVGATLVNLAVKGRRGKWTGEFAEATEEAAADLKILAAVLEVLERERFTAGKLVSLQAELRTGQVLPSAAIRKLERIAAYLEHRRNFMVRPFNTGVFYQDQLVLAAAKWRRRFGPHVRGWLAAVGEMEALTALSVLAFEHPKDVFPEFVAESPYLEAEEFAHPLLPEARAVRNSLRFDGAHRLVMISGPNMAGKSTFVRGVGISVVLAQCGAPVRAKRLRLSPLAVGASICVLDSLQGGVSRFYAEIQRLKLISDLTERAPAVLFLLDELLSGTNSHDRLIGTQSLVHALLAQGAIGLITTHDLALTRIAETSDGVAANCHFEDHLEDGQLRFDYRLKPGVVQTSNALRLMKSIGLAVE